MISTLSNVATYSKENARVARGLVKWFNDCKGYGFIQSMSDGVEVFVHHTGIVVEEGYRSLVKGDQVQFELIVTDQGAQASNVTLLANKEATADESNGHANGQAPRQTQSAIRSFLGEGRNGGRRMFR